MITEFSAGITPLSRPDGITAGADGNLWFTERGNPGRVGQITPAGAVTEFATGITPGSEPHRIASGPDGNLWFTETAADRIGRVDIQVAPAPMTGVNPPSQSLAAPAVTATAPRPLSSTSITLNGLIDVGTQLTMAVGECRSPSGQIFRSPGRVLPGSGPPGPAAFKVAGLKPFTLYVCRILALNAAGSAQGQDQRIRTKDAKLVLKVARRIIGQENISTRLRYRISVPATVAVQVVRAAASHGQGSRSRRLRRNAHRGRNAVMLPALGAGRYRITLTAVARDGQRRAARSALRVPTTARDPFFTG